MELINDNLDGFRRRTNLSRTTFSSATKEDVDQYMIQSSRGDVMIFTQEQSGEQLQTCLLGLNSDGLKV